MIFALKRFPVLARYFNKQSEYAKNIVTLFTGTVLAQSIPILITPILTRIYSPEDFGLFSLVFSIASLLSVVATGQYELAILMPKNSVLAANIVKLVFLICIIFCVLCLFFFLLFKDETLRFFKMGKLNNWIFIIPVLIFTNVAQVTLGSWCNRKKGYKLISKNKILETSVTGSFNIGLGLLGHFFGLIIGRVLGQIFSVISYFRNLRQDNLNIKKFEPKKISFVAKRYIKFPKFLIAAHLFNTGASEVPTILVNTFFGSTVLGFFGFCRRIATAPLAVITATMGNVFREAAAKNYAETGNCIIIFKKTLRILFLISFLPFFIFYFSAPVLFAFIFGEEWREAGVYAQYLTPMFFIQFLYSPLSVITIIAEKQEVELLWQFALFTSNIISIVVGAIYFDIKTTLFFFSTSYSILYLIGLYLAYYYSKGSGSKQ
jgi:O-antigen/teichoic acid export membrane protein